MAISNLQTLLITIAFVVSIMQNVTTAPRGMWKASNLTNVDDYHAIPPVPPNKSQITFTMDSPFGYFKQKLAGDIGKNATVKKGYFLPRHTRGLDTSVLRNLIGFVKNQYQLIYPGTLWCGDGHQAFNYDDLGFLRLSDSCCREHDYCTDVIDPGGNRSGITNNGLFPRFSCKCDLMFYHCLDKASNFIADTIGIMYFDVLAPQCFQMERPVVQCRSKILLKCIEYVVDSSEERRLQWFDNPAYFLRKLITIIRT